MSSTPTRTATGRCSSTCSGGSIRPSSSSLETITTRRHGALKTLHFELRTALLWEGYELGLDSIAMDVMHSSLDTIVTAVGRPQSITAVGATKAGGGSAAEVLLTYPDTVVHYSASALMPKPYGVRGGWRATFTDAVIESTWTAGYDGRPTTTLTEHSETGSRDIDLPTVDAYAAVIDHVIACCLGHATSRLDPGHRPRQPAGHHRRPRCPRRSETDDRGHVTPIAPRPARQQP